MNPFLQTINAKSFTREKKELSLDKLQLFFADKLKYQETCNKTIIADFDDDMRT